MNEHFITGFIKQALAYGYTETQAVNLLKTAFQSPRVERPGRPESLDLLDAALPSAPTLTPEQKRNQMIKDTLLKVTAPHPMY